MTTSTDNKQETPTDPKKNKPTKAKGPIRTEAVVPIVIILVLGFLYFKFFFDYNVKNGIEWTGTYIHGAEVNVGQFKSSFLNGSFSLKNLQVTDKADPKRNLIHIGEIRFGFLWDALLRAKFVVHDAGITQIQIYSNRKKAGWVKPPPPPGAPVSKNASTLEKIEQETVTKVQKDNDGNALGNIATILGGVDEKELLKKIQGNLKAEAKINDLQKELKEKQKAWKERLDSLPQKEEFDGLAARAKALKFDSKNPKQFAADLKEVSNILKEADAKVDNLKSTSKELKSDLDKYKSEFGNLDNLVKQDIADLENQLQIPSTDLGDLSKSLFTAMVAKRLGSLQKYMELGRQYLPPPKDPNAPKEPELIPPKRGDGKNYKFPITTGYPLFWLKKAAISSEPTADGFSGKIQGELTNVTSNPKYIKKPAILNVKGDFPNSQIYGVDLRVIIDHVDAPKESLELTVGSFPFNNQAFVSDSNLKLGLESSVGTSHTVARLMNEQINMTVENKFQNLKYALTAKSSSVEDALRNILTGIPVITVNAHVTGTWNKFDIGINSNLGQELGQGLKRYVQEKIDGIKQKIRDYVQGKIKGQREELTGEFNKIKGQTDKVLGSKQAELDKAQSEIKSSTNSSKSSGSKKMKDDLKEKGKKLLKGLKF